ncbi:MAG: hypothetical protein HY731_15435 [Candidatus Tectomicrobia bacterium]|nr:hypothetical protein [Candidatus Tectomicrobia bacterium]
MFRFQNDVKLALSVFLSVALFLTGCTTPRIEKAFRGKLGETEDNRVITEYCQSCHTHRNQPLSTHITDMTLLYDQKPYSEARECSVCHSLDKSFLGFLSRKTTRPLSPSHGRPPVPPRRSS